MKVVLRKKITLTGATVYLRLQKKVKREDIQNYLKGRHFNNILVENRVQEYLKSAGIFFKEEGEGRTTPYGNNVKETGMVEEKEEGKYQIWFTRDDLLFGNRIFYFKREKPEAYNQKLVPLKLDFSGQIFRSLPIKGVQDTIEFSIFKEVKEYPVKINNSDISFVWTWYDLESSSFTFTGKFETAAIDSRPVDFNIDLEKHIKTIVPGWNDKTRRWPIKAEDINNDDTYKYFEYSGSRLWAGYESCEFTNLPVEPFNDEQALMWRDKIINMELEKEYIRPEDFKGIVNTINNNDGFAAFSGKLDVPDMNSYIERLDHGPKSNRGPSYWHLAAPCDLNIGNIY
jgi:hypothetical protein